MSRIAETETSSDKVKTENEMLDVYIANLCVDEKDGRGIVLTPKVSPGRKAASSAAARSSGGDV